MEMEEGEIDLFDDKHMSMNPNHINGYTYYNYLESCDSSQDSNMKFNTTPNHKTKNKENMNRGFNKMMGISTKHEESKKVCVQVNVSDIGSVDSRSTGQRGRPRSSSQPTENNEKMIKEPFNSPRKRNKGNLFADTPLKRMDTMSNNSHNKFKSGFSMDGCSVDGALKKRSLFKNYMPYKAKEKKMKNKFPTLLKNSKKNNKK